MAPRTEAQQELAVVTGASAGIGAELARQLAAAGHPVLAVARRADRLEQLAAEAKAKGWAPVYALALDVCAEGAAAAVRARADALGGAEWLVNNAGTAKFGRTVEVDAASQAAQVRLNCESVVALTAAFLPGMVERRRGVILNVASTAGFQPTPLMGIYGASKAFVVSYSEALAVELEGTGVTVTALCPGPVATELFQVSAPGVPRKAPAHEISAEACARFGIDAARRGRVIAVPGAQNKLVAAVMPMLPRGLVRSMMARMGLSYLGYQAGRTLPPPGPA
jgi:hypothetical protein